MSMVILSGNAKKRHIVYLCTTIMNNSEKIPSSRVISPCERLYRCKAEPNHGSLGEASIKIKEYGFCDT